MMSEISEHALMSVDLEMSEISEHALMSVDLDNVRSIGTCMSIELMKCINYLTSPDALVVKNGTSISA